MEVPVSNGLKHDNEEKALRSLLDAFGSVFSLKEIASAYCDAGRDADRAGEILYDMQGSASTLTAHASDSDARSDISSEATDSNSYENSCHAHGKFRAPKQKWRAVSGGTISSVLGKEYVKNIPAMNGPHIRTKPLKLDSVELPMSELWGEGSNPNPSKDDRWHKDMEDFLFKMLGDGFQLSRDVIQDVLDKCGYDMQKSMEILLDQSAETSDRKNKALGKSTEKFPDACTNSLGASCQRKVQNMNSTGVGNIVTYTDGEELHGQQKERNDLPKEILAALFNGTERSEESPRRSVKAVRRSGAFGPVVYQPPKDSTVEHRDLVIPSHRDIEVDDDEDGEGSYQALRRAVKEYRGAMKEYYKAAADAFDKGDFDQASKHLKQGQFFFQKARDADEESNLKIFETRNVETQDQILLDLHEHGAKEAIRSLRCHLSSLSGIPSIKYLKVIIEANNEDISKGLRRRMIMKQLEKESIQWIDGENAGTILIRVDNINPKRLSFAKK
ncbi:DUF1771 domain-containing protein [Cephalotus follicularis]|uniref:DUF1771 domain-containing protein n=1 Tax=Cephalotus follicularis TaxID=3775 RepID=A0A1Q3DG55_CEPFO|nr:DUF1771 domain-containing protein [Cephalotus follicularis]